jgi:hypothetical protein
VIASSTRSAFEFNAEIFHFFIPRALLVLPFDERGGVLRFLLKQGASLSVIAGMTNAVSRWATGIRATISRRPFFYAL